MMYPERTPAQVPKGTEVRRTRKQTASFSTPHFSIENKNKFGARLAYLRKDGHRLGDSPDSA
jgi:hypothetical protein